MATAKIIPGPAAERFKIALKNLEGKQGRVGWFKTSKYEDGTPVAYVATIQEYGVPEKNIPARPHGRPTIAKNKASWSNLAEQGAKAILAGRSDIGKVMEAIGLQAAGDWAKTISEITDPPLAPATVKARQNRMSDKKTVGNLTKPLVDTGLMISTVTNDVINV